MPLVYALALKSKSIDHSKNIDFCAVQVLFQNLISSSLHACVWIVHYRKLQCFLFGKW